MQGCTLSVRVPKRLGECSSEGPSTRSFGEWHWSAEHPITVLCALLQQCSINHVWSSNLSLTGDAFMQRGTILHVHQNLFFSRKSATRVDSALPHANEGVSACAPRPGFAECRKPQACSRSAGGYARCGSVA
jgi:hypothetical protein